MLYPEDLTLYVPRERFWDDDEEYAFNPALLRTCWKIYREALPVFARNTIFLDLDLQGDDEDDLYGQGGLWPEWRIDLRTMAVFPYVDDLPGRMIWRRSIDQDVLYSMTGIKVSVDPCKMWSGMKGHRYSPAPIGPLARLLVMLAEEPQIGEGSQSPSQKKFHLSFRYSDIEDHEGILRDPHLPPKEEMALISGMNQEGILKGLRGLRGIRHVKIDGALSAASLEKLNALALEDKTDAEQKQRLLELGAMTREYGEWEVARGMVSSVLYSSHSRGE